MNKNLKKQIKAYAGVAGVLLTVDKVSAQIIYVDVNPDTVIIENNTSDTLATFYSIDVDGDSIIDFDFKVKCNDCSSSWNSGYIKVHPLNGNKINNALYHIGWWSSSNTQLALNAMKLNCGDTINQNGVWLSSEKYLFSQGDGSVSTDIWSQGAWNPGSDNHLPFLLFKNSNSYFGWMHIRILNRQSFVLKEYAYQTLPNVPVLACDTSNLATGIHESDPQFNFSQQNNSIHISSYQKLNHANISVFDLLGKEILKQPFEGKETTIKINKKGIYFVEVKPVPNSSGSEKGIFRKKVFIY